ncbi:MAG: hypothetical protein UW11_C0012G0014 [Parcubacteria group bacterium GW2011_GWA2_43_9b]|uniref:Uncharacterized protein n=1 Tax=Candidatus Portnoybacteria bacterium RIFCSPLOWO2_02_FULL_39_11 TaxID=1802001 RepID=A0A1G2FRC3_9BACT|nr:MAG: hypothetical protein UW11_C0012G0014 [Parcubacteria group bacterium GW2011_GWA2_43_9b]OGZ40636.1 MAG: hypothetical protein A3B04_02990 [Candidatus Portnoybacteria bacterium RIFCSPLOWO2_02_FULL_39_11]
MNVTLIIGGDPTHGAKIEIINREFSENFKDLLLSFGISKTLEETLDPKTTINSIPEIIPCAFCFGSSMFTDTKLARLLTLTHVNHSLILYDCGKRETYPLCDGCAGIVKEAIFNYGKFLENEEKILSARCENIALLQRFVSKFHKAKLEARRHCPWLEKQPQPDIKVVLSQ